MPQKKNLKAKRKGKKSEYEYEEGVKPINRELKIHTKKADYLIFAIGSYYATDDYSKKFRRRKYYTFNIESDDGFIHEDYDNIPVDNLEELVKYIKKNIIPELEIEW